MLTAQQFKDAAAKRRKTTVVEMEGLGPVTLRALTAGEAVGLQGRVKAAGEEYTDLVFNLIARSWVGEDGRPWFPEAEGEEVARSLDPDSFKIIFTAVLKLNGLDETAVDDAAKNSESGPGASTLSLSRASMDGSTST